MVETEVVVVGAAVEVVDPAVVDVDAAVAVVDVVELESPQAARAMHRTTTRGSTGEAPIGTIFSFCESMTTLDRATMYTA